MLTYSLRALSGVLAFVYTLITLYSCSPTQQAVSENVPDIPIVQEENPVVIDILQPRPSESFALQKAADRFTENRKNLQIHVQTIEGEADYRTSLYARLLAGEATTLFQTFSYRDTQALHPYLLDLSQQKWVHGALAGTLDSVSYNDSLYGIPHSIVGNGLLANQSIWQAAGLSLGSHLTMEKLTESCKDLREQIASAKLKESFPQLEAVTELAAQDRSYLAQQFASIALNASLKTPVQAAQEQAISLGSTGEGLEELIILLARNSSSSGKWPALTQTATNEMVENGLATGRVALIAEGTNVFDRIHSVDPKVAEQIVLLPIPLPDSELSYVYVQAASYWTLSNALDAQTQTAALDFLKWLYDSKEGAEVLAKDFKILSPYLQYAADTGNPLHRQLLQYIENGQVLPHLYREAPEGWTSDVFASRVQDYLNQRALKWETVIENWETEWLQQRTETERTNIDE